MSLVGSLLAFGGVFVLVALALSAAACLALALAGPWLAGRGPAAERRAAELAVAVPVLTGALVVGVLLVHSIVTLDHCPRHDHHAHLCLTHAAEWTRRPWAVALGAALAAAGLARLALVAGGAAVARRRVAALARLARRDHDVHLVASPRVFCFVAGWWRPRIFVSSAAWHGLDDDERAAMLAHERAHVRARDVARRAALDLLAVLSAPLAPGFLTARWDSATERLRDREAARATAPDVVARALVRMCRLGAVRVAGASLGSGGARLVQRVRAVLAEAPTGDRWATRLTRTIGSLLVVAALAAVVLADPLHHALETLLG